VNLLFEFRQEHKQDLQDFLTSKSLILSIPKKPVNPVYVVFREVKLGRHPEMCYFPRLFAGA